PSPCAGRRRCRDPPGTHGAILRIGNGRAPGAAGRADGDEMRGSGRLAIEMSQPFGLLRFFVALTM
ncbi:MAG: hypothetical protein V3S51_03730, partial [Dehalococcoidia bacterium]